MTNLRQQDFTRDKLDAYRREMSAQNAADIKTDQPMTEVETLGRQLAETAAQMRDTADRIERRLDAFTQCGQTAVASGTPERLEPQPGTLAALHYWRQTIDDQARRLMNAADTLQTIL